MMKVENVVGYKVKLRNRRVILRHAFIDGESTWQIDTNRLMPDGSIYKEAHRYSDEAMEAIVHVYLRIREEMAQKEDHELAHP